MASNEAVIPDDPVVRAQRQWVTDALDRQLVVMRELEAEALQATAPVTRALCWIALRRHATGRLRLVDGSGRGWARLMPELVATHRRAVEEMVKRAAVEVGALDEVTRRQATGRLGVRLAVMGKGGSGKTLVSSTLARLLARRGRTVLAVDLDPNPGLAFGLGLQSTNAGLPREALDRDDDGGWHTMLAPRLTPVDSVQRFAALAPDGVRYIGIGKITDPERTAFRRSMGPLLQIVFNLARPDWDVIGDLEAGGSTPFQGYHYFADRVLLIVGPSWKSALTARRLHAMLCGVPATIVANRFAGEADHPGLEPDFRVPLDPAVTEADRLGFAPIDHCPDGPAVRAIAELADRLTSEEVLV